MTTGILQLYDIKTKETLLPFLEDWCKGKGKPITHGLFNTPTRHMEEFQSYWYIKNKMELLKEINGISLISGRPGVREDIAIEIDWVNRVFELSWDRSKVDIDHRDKLSLIRHLLEHMTIDSGVCFDEKSDSIQETLSPEELYDLSDQGIQGAMDLLDKLDPPSFEGVGIRKLHPLNIIPKSFLKIPIEKNNMTLEEWIREKKGRGDITPLNSNLVIWDIEEKYLSSIEQTLPNFFEHARSNELVREET